MQDKESRGKDAFLPTSSVRFAMSSVSCGGASHVECTFVTPASREHRREAHWQIMWSAAFNSTAGVAKEQVRVGALHSWDA